MSKHAIPWAALPDGKDYIAAYDLLALSWGAERAEPAIKRLRDADLTEAPAADIAQAAGFDPLPMHDPGVLRELRKVIAGKHRPPILCVHGPHGIVIADGHHRLSLAYQIDPCAPVRLQLA